MAQIKLLCCADLHLGRSSAWIAGPGSVDRSSVGAWHRITDAAIHGSADAVLIAGDIFDGLSAYYEARQEFRKGLERLQQAEIPVFAVAGNHDWDTLPQFAKTFPNAGLHLLGLGGWTRVEFKGIHLVGWSFPSPTVKQSALANPPTREGNIPLVGILHGDATTQDSAYHPLRPSDLLASADAWILGHIHRPGSVHPHVQYPGSPQALDFGPGERGVHGFVWLTIDGGIATFSELIPTSTVLFHDETFVIRPGDASLESAVEEALERRCEELKATAPGVVSVQLRARLHLVSSSTTRTTPVSPSARHGWQIVEEQVVPVIEPRDYIAGADARGEMSRLLLAVSGAEDADPESLELSQQILEEMVNDIDALWRGTIARSTDETSESKPVPPTREEALQIARSAIVARLIQDLAASAARMEVSA